MYEPAEGKWNRIQKKIQQAIFNSYPNPNREGCLEADGLSDLARRAAEVGTLEGDDCWEHVTHCSPCYEDFLAARARLRKSDDGAGRTAKA